MAISLMSCLYLKVLLCLCMPETLQISYSTSPCLLFSLSIVQAYANLQIDDFNLFDSARILMEMITSIVLKSVPSKTSLML